MICVGSYKLLDLSAYIVLDRSLNIKVSCSQIYSISVFRIRCISTSQLVCSIQQTNFLDSIAVGSCMCKLKADCIFAVIYCLNFTECKNRLCFYYSCIRNINRCQVNAFIYDKAVLLGVAYGFIVYSPVRELLSSGSSISRYSKGLSKLKTVNGCTVYGDINSSRDDIPRYSLGGYLSCLVFSEFPGPVVWGLTLIWGKFSVIFLSNSSSFLSSPSDSPITLTLNLF